MSIAYEKLAKHLDHLPGGFPSTASGVEMRILKRLFTPEEAEIAVGLTMTPEPPSAISKRLKTDEAKLSPILDDMSRKGLIYRMTKGEKTLYMAAQFVVGIWEYHVNDLDEDLIRDVNEYLPELMSKTWLKPKTKMLRVVPIAKSISAGMNIMPYEQAEKIIRENSKIVVAPCICRKEHQMIGGGCGRLMESCLILGGGAYYYEENKLGRPISQEEALEILNKGMKAGLVLQPGNSKKPTNICLCCGCCCLVLKNLKTLDAPAKAVCSNYYAEVYKENCTACGACEEICQMDAISVNDTALVNRDRCIGCGLCVSACDFDAMKLMEKPDSEKFVPPASTVETYMNIAKERGLIV